MNITLDFVIKANSVGILAKITLIVMEHDFTIIERSKTDHEANHLMLSLSYNDGIPDPKQVHRLLEALKTLTQINTVLKTDLKNTDSLLTISNTIVQKYPNIIGCLHEYEQKLDKNGENNKAAILYDVGQRVGKKIALHYYKGLMIDDSITNALKKIVLPVISPFALAKITDNELHVSICPFCIKADNLTVPQCDFLTGLISGLINTKKTFYVKEIACRAQQNAACVFLVTKISS
jgi:predicted hydrocarbon binding protein